MKLTLEARLNDTHLDGNKSLNQRLLEIGIATVKDNDTEKLPLNLCLILDHSGSMDGLPLETVKQAAIALIEQLNINDVISVIAFDHSAKVIIPSQVINLSDISEVIKPIQSLKAQGGTCIDQGLKVGLQEIAKNQENRMSQILLLTDGENEHGNDDLCLKLAKLATECNVTLNALGFGHNWNQNLLESISDLANGTLCYIESPEKAVAEFSKIFSKIQTVGLTNAYLFLDLKDNIRLAELKPIAQVYPETVELPLITENNQIAVRLGDLMTDERLILVNLYIGELPPGLQTILTLQVRYDDPCANGVNIESEILSIDIEVQEKYTQQSNPQVEKSVLTLAKYRQTQIAEVKLAQGDVKGAATMLQTAAKTALQLGDQTAATVLQVNATKLQSGEELSQADKKKTRMVSKTILQSS